MIKSNFSLLDFRKSTKSELINSQFLIFLLFALRIAAGEKEFNFHVGRSKQEVIKVNMEVVKLDGFSGHAGRNELMDFVNKLQPRPRKILINHGESKGCLQLASAIHKTYRIETIVPRNLEAVRLK